VEIRRFHRNSFRAEGDYRNFPKSHCHKTACVGRDREGVVEEVCDEGDDDYYYSEADGRTKQCYC
jgi:hypothetical protein